MQDRRHGDRLGDARRGRELPACGGAAREWPVVSGQLARRTRRRYRPCRKLAPPIESRRRRCEAAAASGDFYHETLKQSPEALRVSRKARPDASGNDRAVSSSASRIARWGIGCRTSNRKSPARSCAGRLQKLGIFRESGHEHFNGSLVIPVFSRRRRGRDVRPQDHRRASARGHAAASVSAGSASRRVERGSASRLRRKSFCANR